MSRSPKLLHPKAGQNSGGSNSPSREALKDSLQDHPLAPPPQCVYMPQFMYPPAYGPAVFTPAPFMHYPMPTTMTMAAARPGLLALPTGPTAMHQAAQFRMPHTPVKQDIAATNSLPITVVANASQHGYHTPLQTHPAQFQHRFGRSHIICQYYLKGSCKFGASCRYLHPPLTAVPNSPHLPDLTSPHFLPHTPHQPPTPDPPMEPPAMEPPATALSQPTSQATKLDDSTQAQLHRHTSLTPPPQLQPFTPSTARSSIQPAVGLKFQLICQLDTRKAETCASGAPIDHFAALGQDLYLSSSSQVHNYKIIFCDEALNGYLHAEQASRFVSTFDLSLDHSGSRTTSDAVSCICCPCAEGVVWLGSNQGSIVRHDFSLKKTARVLNGQVSLFVQAQSHMTGVFQFVSAPVRAALVYNYVVPFPPRVLGNGEDLQKQLTKLSRPA